MDALAADIGAHNDACEDGDRGRGNHAACIVVCDDGSGFYCGASHSFGDDSDRSLLTHSRQGFDTTEDGAALLLKQLEL